MLAMRFVRLIEAHSEVLSKGLTEQIRKSDRTSDFRKIPAQELRLADRGLPQSGRVALTEDGKRHRGAVPRRGVPASGGGDQPAPVCMGADPVARPPVALPQARVVRGQYRGAARRDGVESPPEPVFRPRPLLRGARIRTSRAVQPEGATGPNEGTGGFDRTHIRTHRYHRRTVRRNLAKPVCSRMLPFPS